MTYIADIGLDVSREPLTHAFGFKGAYFTEKWLCHVTLQGRSGKVGRGLGGLAILWSDPAVFHAHTEVGGNLIMCNLLEHALHLARGMSFDTPFELLDRLMDQVHEYGCRITDNLGLRRTFTLNALVALDYAAWALRAAEMGATDFDALLPEGCCPALNARHNAVAVIPLVSYKLPVADVAALAEQGCFVFKIKIGAPGDPATMLARDSQRLTEIHDALKDRRTERTESGHVLYHLDANGRYPDRALMERLLDHARAIGMLDHVVILEEPFAEEADLDVHGLGVRVAADESLHHVADVAHKLDLGYGAFALKPAGKTMSMTLRMAAEAHKRGAPCFVADSACVPVLVDWNKNVAARLAPFPGLTTGLQESNGAQHYANWPALLAAHPPRRRPLADPARRRLRHRPRFLRMQRRGVWVRAILAHVSPLQELFSYRANQCSCVDQKSRNCLK